jgi:hypothetical protein
MINSNGIESQYSFKMDMRFSNYVYNTAPFRPDGIRAILTDRYVELNDYDYTMIRVALRLYKENKRVRDPYLCGYYFSCRVSIIAICRFLLLTLIPLSNVLSFSL